MSFDNSTHLQNVLDTHKMSHVQAFVDKVKKKRTEIVDNINSKYSTSQRYNAFNSGSMAKHTATNIKFDMDVVIPFKHSAFATLEEMFDALYDFLNEMYGQEATVRKQKVSIGIEYPIEEGDEKPIQVDIVPGRELSDDDYRSTHDLNLYFNADHWGFKKGSRQKTNIQKQIDHISGRLNERKIIRLLKIWKKQNSKDYKSFMLELFCIKALDGRKSVSLWDDLKYTMEYIRDNVENESFHLYDPGNSANDIMSSMSNWDKASLKSEMTTILNNIELLPETYLPFYFRVNDKYVEAGKEEQQGFQKKEYNNNPSYPRTPQRFG